MSRVAAALRSPLLGLGLLLAPACTGAGAVEAPDGVGSAGPDGVDSAVSQSSGVYDTCKTVRLQTDEHARDLANRQTRERSDAGMMADLGEQARLRTKAGEELTKTGETSPDRDLGRLVVELGAIQLERAKNATAAAEAMATGDKKKETDLLAMGDAITKRDRESFEKFEDYCASHGAPYPPE